MPFFDLIASATQSRSLAVGSQRLLNLYPEQTSEGNRVLYGTPGLQEWLQVGTGPIRGFIVAGTALYVVSGNGAYKVDGQKTITSLGAVAGSGPVSMASNGVQVFIASGLPSYLITLGTGAMTQITDPDFPGASSVAFVDGFFVFVEPSSARFWATGSYDGGAIDPLSFATAEYTPDQLVALLVDHREIWLFGSGSIEVWFNSGGSGFPFERIAGAVIDQGCAAPLSIARADNSVFWLGNDADGSGIVWRANGYSPQRVSTHDLEHKLSSYGNIANAEAWTYQQDGHIFYVLNFPTQDVTWCYDIATGVWHERASYSSGDQSLHRHRGRCHAAFSGLNLVGDYASNQIHILSLDAFKENSELIVRELISPHIRSGKRAFYPEAEVRMESGVGLQSGQGADPQIMLQMSDDGGRTWGSEHWRSFGRVGQHLHRVVWRRLGSSFTRTFRLRITDPVPVVLITARVEFSE